MTARQESLVSIEIRQGLMALATGALSGVFTAVMLGLISGIGEQLWGEKTEQGLTTSIPLLWSLVVCGGVGVILAVVERGDDRNLLPELPETMEDLRDPDHAPQRHEWRSILAAALAQIGGAPVGPEALLTRLVTIASQTLWRGRDRALSDAAVAGSLGMFEAPLLGGVVVNQHRVNLHSRWIPGSIGGIAGFAVFGGILEVTGGSMARVPYIWPTTFREDLGSVSVGLLAGLVGSALGLALRQWRGALQRRQLLKHWRWWPVITGLLLGMLLHWFPMVGFAGEHQVIPLLDGANKDTVPLLLSIGLLKLLMLGLCLETGWRGGIFFPGFVLACAFGGGLHELLPQLGSIGSWCAGVTSGFFMLMLGRPLVVLVLSICLMQGHGTASALIGVGVAVLISRRFGGGNDVPPPHPETPDSPECPEPQS